MRHYIHRYVLRIDAHRCSPVVHWLLLRTQPSAAVILSPHLLAPAWPHVPEEIDLHVSETPTRSPNSAEVALITQQGITAGRVGLAGLLTMPCRRAAAANAPRSLRPGSTSHATYVPLHLHLAHAQPSGPPCRTIHSPQYISSTA